MKKIIIHSVPAAISFVWLALYCQTLNPVDLAGPRFLKFYLILTIGFYISAYSLKFSKTSFYFMIFIFILGIIKLIKGLIIDRPIGILFSILVVEIITIMVVGSTLLNHKIKK